MKIVKNIATNTAIKCPYDMKPTRIIVHNTANDASAKNEIAYMVRNNNKVSFHYAVDDIEVVQGIEENRNSWNAGDGANGKGNREGIAIEICYSKSGGDRFIKSEKNAVKLIVDILKRYGWGIDKVTKHQDYSKKNCPHRTLELGWDRFIKMIQEEIAPVKVVNDPHIYTVKKGDSLSVIGKNLGIKWQDIAKLNNIKSPYVINVGQTIKLPTNTVVKPVVKPVAKPKVNYLSNSRFNVSITTALKQIGVNNSYAYRAKLANANGIRNYKGTLSQNVQLLNLLKNGKLIRA